MLIEKGPDHVQMTKVNCRQSELEYPKKITINFTLLEVNHEF